MWPTLLPVYFRSFPEAAIGFFDSQGVLGLLLGKVDHALLQGPKGNDLAGRQIVGRMRQRGLEPLLGIPGRGLHALLELIVILGHDGFGGEEDLPGMVLRGIRLVSSLASFKTS